MTITELRAIAAESGLKHAEFCLEQHTSQVGRDAADPLWVELDKLEMADYIASRDEAELEWAEYVASHAEDRPEIGTTLKYAASHEDDPE